MNRNFDDLLDLELFFDEENEENGETSDEEAPTKNQAQVLQNAVHWPPILQEIRDLNILDTAALKNVGMSDRPRGHAL